MWTARIRAVKLVQHSVCGAIKTVLTPRSTFKREPRMTVGELCKKLEGIDPRTEVVVQWEIDNAHTYFDVAAVSLRKGTPSRIEGIAGFAFGGDGSPAWLFIDVEEA
jgi:hypothetical protein